MFRSVCTIFCSDLCTIFSHFRCSDVCTIFVIQPFVQEACAGLLSDTGGHSQRLWLTDEFGSKVKSYQREILGGKKRGWRIENWSSGKRGRWLSLFLKKAPEVEIMCREWQKFWSLIDTWQVLKSKQIGNWKSNWKIHLSLEGWLTENVKQQGHNCLEITNSNS